MLYGWHVHAVVRWRLNRSSTHLPTYLPKYWVDTLPTDAVPTSPYYLHSNRIEEFTLQPYEPINRISPIGFALVTSDRPLKLPP